MSIINNSIQNTIPIYNFTFFNAGVIFINGMSWREKRMTEYHEKIQDVFDKVGYLGYR